MHKALLSLACALICWKFLQGHFPIRAFQTDRPQMREARFSSWSITSCLPITRSEPPEASYPVQRHSHVIRNIKTYSTPSLALCPIMEANKLPDFSRQ